MRHSAINNYVEKKIKKKKKNAVFFGTYALDTNEPSPKWYLIETEN